MKTVEPLAAKSPTGDIEPNLLSTQVSKSFKDRAYRPSELDQLAKVGMRYMKASLRARTCLRVTRWAMRSARSWEPLGATAIGGPVGSMAGALAVARLAQMWARLGQVAPSGNALAGLQRAMRPPPAMSQREAISAMMSARGADTLR
jgi:hypothetical protein